MSQLQLHTFKVIVIVIVIEKTITITLLPISELYLNIKLRVIYYKRV